MLFDCHVHSAASADSAAGPSEMINAARAKGAGLVFTEHYDKDYSATGGYNYKCDLAAYLSAYEKYRAPGVLLGVEIGLTAAEMPVCAEVARKHPFDFVLGAVHLIDETDIYIDLKSENPTVTGEMYFDYLIKLTGEAPFIDALAHIDYPNRYDARRKSAFVFTEHAERLRALFSNLVKNGIALEINSRRLKNADITGEMLGLYALYKERGGKFVTLGSDAHAPRDMFQNFKDAARIAEACGLTPVVFKNRKMDYIV